MKAGRVVGLVTAGVAVVSLVYARSTYYESVEPLFRALGVGDVLPVSLLAWGNALFALTARYTTCYVVGSLVGVVYDWLDRPSLRVLFSLVLVVGLVDGFLAILDTRSILVGSAYVLAWLCYVPVFAWLFDDTSESTKSGPRRL